MDLYTTIAKNGGQIILDGFIARKFISKDGSKIVQQIASKTGEALIDVFDRTTRNSISAYRKTMKGDGKSYLTKFYNYITQQGKIQAISKQQIPGSFMVAMFKTQVNGKINAQGDFFANTLNGSKKGKITYFPVGDNSINTSDIKIKLPVTIFNRQFGKIDGRIF